VNSNGDTWPKVLIAAFVSLLVAVIAAWALLHAQTHAAPLSVAKFTSPLAGEKVHRAGNLPAAGVVSNLKSDETVWLLDQDKDTYTADQQARVVGNKWSAVSTGPFGDASAPVPFGMDIVIAIATPACDQALNAKSQADDSTMQSLPSGCRPTDARHVTVIS
jgi:hypothetical protein